MTDNQEKPLPLVSLADALAFCCYLHGQTPCECWYYMNQMEMMVIMIAAVMKVMGTGFKDLQPGLWFVFCLGGWPGHTSYLPYTALLYNKQCVEHALLVLYSRPQATHRCTICSNVYRALPRLPMSQNCLFYHYVAKKDRQKMILSFKSFAIDMMIFPYVWKRWLMVKVMYIFCDDDCVRIKNCIQKYNNGSPLVKNSLLRK